MSKVTWKFNLDGKQESHLRGIMERCSFTTPQELFEGMTDFFDRAVNGAEHGREIGSYDNSTDVFSPINFEALQNARRHKTKHVFIPLVIEGSKK